TPSTSKPTSLRRRANVASSIAASSRARRGCRLRSVLDAPPALSLGPRYGGTLGARALPDVECAFEDLFEVVQRQHVWAVGWGVVGIGVCFQEKRVGARGGGGVQQGRNELAQAAARAVRARAGLLHGVRGVEDHRTTARRAQPH